MKTVFLDHLAGFTSAGDSKERLEFILFLIGCLLIVTDVPAGADCLHKNGKKILQRGLSIIREQDLHTSASCLISSSGKVVPYSCPITRTFGAH